MKRTTWFLSADHPRLLRLISWVEAGEDHARQVRLHDMSKELGIPVNAVMRYKRWAELYGIIRVYTPRRKRLMGQPPHRMEMLMSVEEWRKNGPRIISELQGRLNPPKPRKYPKKPRVQVVPEEWVELQAQAAREVQAALAGDPLPKLEVIAIEPENLDAWGEFSS